MWAVAKILKRRILKRRFELNTRLQLGKATKMRTQIIYLFTFIGIASCWLGTIQPAHGQLAQAIDDYKRDRPFQYTPCDPWSRSKLFNRQTKHSGFSYNCDGEESKRNSPYICWKTHYENDIPARVGWWQRLNVTAADVKQRIAEGSCNTCQEATSCQCSKTAPSHHECSNCVAASDQMLPSETKLPKQANSFEKVRPAVSRPAKRIANSAGLESLDILTR